MIAANIRFRKADIKNTPGGEQLKADKLLLLAHSMGGLAIPRFAHKEPGSIYKMIGMMPAGFGYPTVGAISKDTPKKLYGSAKHELIPALTQGSLELSWRNVTDLVQYYTRLRFLYEGISCLRDDIRPIVQDLADRDIEYTHLAAKHDFLVRPDPLVSSYVTNHRTINNVGHLGPQAKPEVMARHIAQYAVAS